MTFFDYLLRANVCLVALFGLYWLLFRRHTFFTLNRAYLLLALVASALLPLIQLPAPAVAVMVLPTVTLSAVPIAGAVDNSLSISNLGWWLYGLGVVLGLGRLLWALTQLVRLIRAGEQIALPNCTLVLLDDTELSPFSFFRFLIMSQADFAQHPDPILRHEEVHIRQVHSADVLLAEVVKLVCWFNPVAWLLQRALQQTHEFLADSLATEPTNRADYTRFLVGYALGTTPDTLTNSFLTVSSLKSRIIMLQANRTHRRALLGYALALPLALGLLMCTQQGKDNATKPTTEPTVSGNTTVPAAEPTVLGNIFTVVEQQPEFPGGMDKLGSYFGEHLNYPESAQRANVAGRVFVQMVITDKGDVTRVKVLKGIGFGCDEEAVRVIQAMPRWTPGKQNGQPVNVQYNLPINFQLEPEKKTSSNTGFTPEEKFDHVWINGRAASTAEVVRFLDKGLINKTFIVWKHRETKTLEFKTI